MGSPKVKPALERLGQDVRHARLRRRIAIADLAMRAGTSPSSIARLERGDPGVAIGTYATALWLLGRVQAIPDLAAPQHDLGALESEVRVARQRAVRAPVSLDARLRAAHNESEATAADASHKHQGRV